MKATKRISDMFFERAFGRFEMIRWLKHCEAEVVPREIRPLPTWVGKGFFIACEWYRHSVKSDMERDVRNFTIKQKTKQTIERI